MLIVGNGIIVTREKENRVLKGRALCIDENQGVIVKIEQEQTLRQQYPKASYIDANGGLIMPGFINMHHHIYSAFARGLSIPENHPSNFLEILEGTWWRLDHKLTLKQVELSAKVTLVECIKNGVTTVFDHHASYGAIQGSLKTIAQVVRTMGLRANLAYEVSDRDGKEKMQQAVMENIQFIKEVQRNQGQDEQIKAMMGLHASFTLSDESLEYCLEQMPEGFGCHIHVAEGLSDALHCQKNYGDSIVKRLQKKGVLGHKTIAAHCIHIDEEDEAILKETDTMVVHNPESNMGNAVGCPKILRMFEKGVLLGLGTDGYTSDMLESYKVANMLQKHESQNPSAAWSEIPIMLFQNNAHMAGRFYEKPLGVLKEGAYGDVIVVDYHPFTPLDEKNINSHLLFGSNGRDVVTTIVGGKVLMENRKLKIDEIGLMEACQEESMKLWDTICQQ